MADSAEGKLVRSKQQDSHYFLLKQAIGRHGQV